MFHILHGNQSNSFRFTRQDNISVSGIVAARMEQEWEPADLESNDVRASVLAFITSAAMLQCKKRGKELSTEGVRCQMRS